jgi:dTDP-4-dehydrorhamnose 3,5-epimerase
MSEIKDLNIQGCWIFKPQVFSDSRGHFFEWFQDSSLEIQNGKKFQIAQANCSISNKGVLRGIHFAKYPPGQAKYVTCISGKVFDVLVDLRKGSPTFGKWESVILDSKDPSAIYISSGIGHAFMALEDNTSFVYLCDQRYNPSNEFEISPFDQTIGILWPKDIEPILSNKDLNGKSFSDSMEHFSEFFN